MCSDRAKEKRIDVTDTTWALNLRPIVHAALQIFDRDVSSSIFFKCSTSSYTLSWTNDRGHSSIEKKSVIFYFEKKKQVQNPKRTHRYGTLAYTK